MKFAGRTLSEIPPSLFALAAALFAVGSLAPTIKAAEPATTREVDALQSRLDATDRAMTDIRADMRWMWATTTGASLVGSAGGAATVLRRYKSQSRAKP